MNSPWKRHKGKMVYILAAFVISLSSVLFLTGCISNIDSSSALKAAADFSQESRSQATSEGKLRVSYIDVGQGDSSLIQLPNGKTILIDAGENDQGNKVVSYLKSQGIKRLDVTIWTHPHSDHIGGADVITNAFDIGQVVMPKETSTTQSFRSLITSISRKGLRITEAKAGLNLDLGPEVKAEILAPNSSNYEEVNNYSAVLKLTYIETSFLFMGDAQTESEEEMINAGFDLKADILKVGHHGSRTSTSARFLSLVHPKYAVISAGKDNPYGHPSASTIAKLQKAGATIFRTDQSGTITAESDGKNISIKGR
ncbi:ComEC/Rec2 family competence protein [Desulfitobacterium sp. Sab5]|uniref:ComEC/Rec2 family competence protein n=1 Tax=Desulfitobacterium nosdiversum TaxID=3375356 RepID=UPI003CEF56AF